MYVRSTEIRHLSSADIYKLSQIMDPMQFWKKLMRIIPGDATATAKTGKFKYNNDHIRLIECASAKDGRTCTEILLDEWGCSGRSRPTVGFLLELLIKAELFRAADFVALNLLNEPPPERPQKGPAAKVDISIPLESHEVRNIENILDNVSYPGTKTLIENAQVESNLNNQDYYVKLGKGDKNLDVPHSDLMKFSSDSENVSNLTDLVGTESEYIPAISSLHNENSEDILPNLSALNIDDKNKLLDEREDQENSALIVSSNSSNEPESAFPNLSILDRSSLNESSLTNVTATSEENILFGTSGCPPENIPCLSVLYHRD